MESVSDLIHYIETKSPDDVISLGLIMDDGGREIFDIKLEKRPSVMLPSNETSTILSSIEEDGSEPAIIQNGPSTSDECTLSYLRSLQPHQVDSLDQWCEICQCITLNFILNTLSFIIIRP